MEINQLSHLILNPDQLKNNTNNSTEESNDRTSKLLNLFKLNGAAHGPTTSSSLTETHQMILLDPSATSPYMNMGMYEISSESLLQNCLAGNYENVREILENGDFNVNITRRLKYNRSVVKFNEMAAETAYNTYSGGEMPKFKINLEISDEARQTPLILAARFGYTKIGSLLIEYGARVNPVDMDSWTPLLNAAKDGNSELTEILLDNKAFIESRDMGGFTPLIWACYKNRLNCVKVLVKNGANVNAQCKNTVCCLSWAAGRGYTDIVRELLKSHQIKVNLTDRNSSTPLLWGARKGALELVQSLVERGANPDAIGMHNMTPLIMACKSGHLETAMYLAKLNDTTLNHLDKDGHSALSYACKSGHKDLALILLERGAYVNISNKKGDTILITAVKGGHKEIIDALISRHVEIDAIGNQGKTALHHAIEKANVEIVRSILVYKPYLEIVAEDGDTLLLLAVKRKCTSIVGELLNHGSKVSPTDKYGDNVLHISLRNRSRDITELILANPKNSKYLYKPNKRGETPHKIDASNPKSILTQIFGARQLNMTEDSILGYDLYSSALSEILSEPSLHTPITVGLYAKWGSGKSFLLNQLRAEMKSFARLTRVVNLKVNFFMLATIFLLNLLIVTPFLLWQWVYGLILYASCLFASFAVVLICKFYHERKESEWALHICDKLATHLSRFKLLLQVLFLNPYVSKNLNSEHKNLRFIFTEYGKISTIGGENALALMVGGLCTKMEDQLGLVVTRLCRVFYNKTHSHDKFKKFCCIPTFILAILIIVMMLTLAIFLRVKNFNLTQLTMEEQAFISTFGFIIAVSIVGSSVTWIKMIWNLIRSPKSRIRSIHTAHSKHDNAKDPKVESFIFQLKREVDLIAHTVKTIDSFSHSCTRLVIVIDGLDSCEQSKVVQILEIIHVLFTREGDPFISILAVDPHVLIKGIEGNLTAAFRNGSVNGNDYLRTIIHLPVFLQVDLSRAKAISKTPVFKKNLNASFKGSQDVLQTKKFIEDAGNAKNKGKKKSKNKRGTTTTKPMSAYDLTDQLIKSDYFLDVNPRNLRRLINIIALTGRLLRAYHIDFNWRLLASWIYLNEQWPYRCSWLIMFYEEHEAEFDDETTLNDIYERVKHQIPISNEPLLEMDRNARKFEQFIQNCKPALNVSIFKKLLPCTCNLDPYLIKLIKDSIDAFQEKFDLLTHLNGINSNQNTLHNSPFNNNLTFPSGNNNPFPTGLSSYLLNSNNGHNVMSNNNLEGFPNKNISSSLFSAHNGSLSKMQSSTSFNDSNNCFARNSSQLLKQTSETLPTQEVIIEDPNVINMSKLLHDMTVADVIEEVDGHIDFINDDYKQIYVANLRDHNINGKVLECCDLHELKSELQMTFGDWQVFRAWILKQRDLNTKFKAKKVVKQPFVMPVVPETNNNFYELKQQGIERERTPEPVISDLTNKSEEALLQSHRSGRKVEFFISPVVEATPLIRSLSPPPKLTETPTKSILNSNVSIDSESRLLADSTVSKQGSQSSLKSNPDSDGVNNSNNPVSKFSKKIYSYLHRRDSLSNSQGLTKAESIKESDTRQTLLEAEKDEDLEEEDEEEEDIQSNNEDENEESTEENATEATKLTDARK